MDFKKILKKIQNTYKKKTRTFLFILFIAFLSFYKILTLKRNSSVELKKLSVFLFFLSQNKIKEVKIQ